MAWQKCPVCEGSGINPFPLHGATHSPTCSVCHGYKIIDEKTGSYPREFAAVAPGLAAYAKEQGVDFEEPSIFKKMLDKAEDSEKSPQTLEQTNARFNQENGYGITHPLYRKTYTF